MADLRKDLLNKYFIRGSVWKAVETFQARLPRLKYLVILKHDSRYLYYLLPTSNGAYFKRTKGCSFAFCAAGTCPPFVADTYIGCDELRSRSAAEFVALFRNKKIKYVGQLSENVVQGIDSALKKSKLLSPQEKDLLFPPKP